MKERYLASEMVEGRIYWTVPWGICSNRLDVGMSYVDTDPDPDRNYGTSYGGTATVAVMLLDNCLRFYNCGDTRLDDEVLLRKLKKGRFINLTKFKKTRLGESREKMEMLRQLNIQIEVENRNLRLELRKMKREREQFVKQVQEIVGD